MSRQYPIWIDINSCIYKSDKSYGIRSDGHQRIYVGTSSRNSHPFANVNIQRHETDEGTEFSYFVDDVLIKRAVLTKKGLIFKKEIK